MILGNPLLGFLLSSFLKNLLRYDIKYAHMAKKLGLLVKKKYIYIYIGIITRRIFIHTIYGGVFLILLKYLFNFLFYKFFP